MFHPPLLDVPDPFPSFCSTPPLSTPTALLVTGIRRSPLHHSVGHLLECTPITDLGMEGEFVVCEQIEEIGQEQSPARVKAPPQKRRAVIRVESAETQDYVSEPQWLEGG